MGNSRVKWETAEYNREEYSSSTTKKYTRPKLKNILVLGAAVELALAITLADVNVHVDVDLVGLAGEGGRRGGRGEGSRWLESAPERQCKVVQDLADVLCGGGLVV